MELHRPRHLEVVLSRARLVDDLPRSPGPRGRRRKACGRARENRDDRAHDLLERQDAVGGRWQRVVQVLLDSHGVGDQVASDALEVLRGTHTLNAQLKRLVNQAHNEFGGGLLPNQDELCEPVLLPLLLAGLVGVLLLDLLALLLRVGLGVVVFRLVLVRPPGLRHAVEVLHHHLKVQVFERLGYEAARSHKHPMLAKLAPLPMVREYIGGHEYLEWGGE